MCRDSDQTTPPPLAAALITPRHQPGLAPTPSGGAGDASLLAAFRTRPVEKMHVVRSEYDRSTRTVVVTWAEAVLVGAYIRWLGIADTAIRSETPSGITDVHVEGPSGAEIVEAKRTAGHLHCRAALGQLLDYATSMPVAVDRLTALFPARPRDADVGLLHAHGIDCVFPQVDVFIRLGAPGSSRERMRPIWDATTAPAMTGQDDPGTS